MNISEQHIDLFPLAELKGKEHPQPIRQLCGLYHAAFVREEQRPWGMLLSPSKKPSSFRPMAIYHGDELAGLCSYWELPSGWLFVEHIAIFARHRNRGLGSLLLSKLRSLGELILEIEPPTLSSQARRRLEFYQRNGFKTIDKYYQQPPYREGDAPTPLWLLSTEAIDPEYIKQDLYSLVYGLAPDRQKQA
ncbi:GNAT family N-acetyltransferase [Porphyromonas crevioricanis]|uniref:N-acetyltransferase domain-containing protein n=2 Tax=Porphyromonas crevioricanis TaxID=393921 RepID=A0A2X4PIZ8_9PORP|nr:GNAT family N-acetyltransferase [Porphyromonas crevioricanis]GAD04669.1 hypothetical protein PORCRE_360 [Porphyromonas crevioricanis JCM 15906]GAD07172.1 hypothetical protein PORCAN_790 [Porphyromonas crevioricanis JCM 13913]SJZ66783.1 Acetyltransferase (GNAT) domain-containing protein [Porphyromonas crevioricanis]SQH73944.1 Uncharacterised protein [Porphyromonas crevioricanis]